MNTCCVPIVHKHLEDVLPRGFDHIVLHTDTLHMLNHSLRSLCLFPTITQMQDIEGPVMLCPPCQCLVQKCFFPSFFNVWHEVICHFQYTLSAQTCTQTHTHTGCLQGSIFDIYTTRLIPHSCLRSIAQCCAKRCTHLWKSHSSTRRFKSLPDSLHMACNLQVPERHI